MRKILIVDDSPTIRRMVAASLQTLEDVFFSQASNGLEAIEILARERVSLMILDLNMPDMHGLEVLQFVRSHEQYRRLPIIVLTTKYDPESRPRGRRIAVLDEAFRARGAARTYVESVGDGMSAPGKSFFDQFLNDYFAESEEHVTSARNIMLSLESAGANRTAASNVLDE